MGGRLLKAARVVFAAVPLALLSPLFLSAPSGAAEDTATAQIMPVSEVRAGMTGYGLTAFRGVSPERFDVEVLGVLRGAFAKGDLVLIRMSGPVINETGTIAGMSGSPIYVDGKLLGAVAYGWRYAKVPVAGVTPAEDMMRVKESSPATAAEHRAAAKERAREVFRAGSRDLATLLSSGERGPEFRWQVRRTLIAMAAPPSPPATTALAYAPDAYPPAVRRLLPQEADPQMRPLPIPITVSGAAAGGGSLLSLLPDGAFLPVQAAAASGTPAASRTPAPSAAPAVGSAASAEARLEPGVPVGAALVTGDLDVAGMGTLTWVEGNRALAFGHPMLGSGETDIPLAIGEVQAVVPSLMNSFKLTSTGRIVGRITDDREPAVLATLGEQAPTFPCKVHIKGVVNEDYDYRVAGYWALAPMLAAIAISESSMRWEGSESRYTLKARAEIGIEGRSKPLVLQNVYTSSSPLSPVFDLVLIPTDVLLLNPYQEVRIERVNYDLEVTPGFEAAMIKSAWADRARVRPGSDVTVHVRLQHYRGEEMVQKVQVRIPETAKPGSQVTILLCDATVQRSIKQSLDPGLFEPRDLETLVRMIEESESNKSLFIRASVLEEGLRFAGEAMPALPPSAISVLEYAGAGAEAQPLTTDYVTSVETPWVLEGAERISVLIEEPKPFSP